MSNIPTNIPTNQFAQMIKSRHPDREGMHDIEAIRVSMDDNPQYMRMIDVPDYIKEQSKYDSKKIFEEESPLERGLIGAGKGMLDIYEGGKQVIGLGDESYGEEQKLYEQYSEGDPYALAGEIAGATVATLPLGGAGGAAGKGLSSLPKLANLLRKAPKLTKTAKYILPGATAGGAMGTIDYADENESRLQNALYGGLFGAGGELATKLIGKIGKKAFNSLKGKHTNSSTQELIDLANEYDVPLSFGDVTGESVAKKLEVIAEDIPIIGTGAFRKKGLAKTQEAMKKTADKFKKEMIDTGDDLGKDYDVILEKSAISHSQKVKKKAKELYDDLKEKTKGTTLEVGNTKKTLNWAQKSLDESLTKNTDIESFMKIVSDKLSKKTTAIPDIPAGPSKFKKTGRKDVVTGADIMDEIPGTPFKEGKKAKGVSFSDLRQLRSDLGNKISDWSISNKKAAGMAAKLKESVEKDLEALAGSPYSEVQQAWKKADKFYKEKVVPVNAKELARALRKDEPDQIYSTFIKAGKGDKAKKFFNALDDKGKSAVRSGMIEEAIEHATSAKGIISPAKFAGRLERFKDAKDVFFEGKAKKEIDGLAKLMRYAERFGQYGENPPTGQRMLALGLTDPYQMAKNLVSMPVIKTLFTTKRGRNFLLASDKLDPMSPKMDKLMSRMDKYLKGSQARALGKLGAEDDDDRDTVNK